jgi:hypothetical protein
MRHSGRNDEALAFADEARAAFARLYPEGHARLGAAALIRGEILRDQGRLADAAVELETAGELLRRFAGAESNITLEAELELADVLARIGRAGESRALHAKVAPLLPARFVEHSPQRLLHAALGRRLAESGPTRG